MKIRKNITLLVCALLTGAVATLAVANTATLKGWLGLAPAELPQEEGSIGKKDPQQQALLLEMAGLLKPFDSTNTSYYLGGTLTAVDRIDSAHALNDIPYQFAKWDQELYMRFGETEMINTKDLNLYVDHAAKKIILSSSKTVMQNPGLPFDKLYEFVRSEGFTVTKKTLNGRMKEISITSPNHISLKGISLSYDSVSRDVRKIHIRQAEVTDPMNEHKEKWISLAIDDWNDDPVASSFLIVKKFVAQTKGQWQCSDAFNEYDLIDQYLQ